MNLHDLRLAQARYIKRIDRVIEGREHLHKIRSKFVRHFQSSNIRTMQVDEYVLGKAVPKDSYNFCYTIERELDGLGRIIGANAFKFGVYYGKTKSDPQIEYRFAKKFGNNAIVAFENVRAKILELLDAGAAVDLVAIANSKISAMFKGKILSTYYPDVYLNVFSPEHLNYFLVKLDLDTKWLIEADAIYKRAALVEFKNRDLIMETWSVDIFSDFLYTEYPGRPVKNGHVAQEPTILEDYEDPEFPPNPAASFIELNILSSLEVKATAPVNRENKNGKIDYEKKARKLKKLGDRGEKIVMDLEAKRLRDGNREDLIKRLDRVSLKSDSYGYDILSFELDGSERYIEVKATTSMVGNANFFLSANELRQAEESENYFIYMVYDVTSTSPQVWPIKNPFKPENESLKKAPVSYYVNINASKK